MCGRGGHSICHPGNLRFRQLVSMYRQRYLSSNRNGKADVTTEVLQQWRSQTPPGRFLKKTDSGDSSPWSDIGDTEAKRKVAQSLREKEPNESLDPSYLSSALACTVADPTLPSALGGGGAPNHTQCFNPVARAAMPPANPLQFFSPPSPLHHSSQSQTPVVAAPAAVGSNVFARRPEVQAVILATTSSTVSMPEAQPRTTATNVVDQDQRAAGLVRPSSSRKKRSHRGRTSETQRPDDDESNKRQRRRHRKKSKKDKQQRKRSKSSPSSPPSSKKTEAGLSVNRDMFNEDYPNLNRFAGFDNDGQGSNLEYADFGPLEGMMSRSLDSLSDQE